jgi:hypothetical protein
MTKKEINVQRCSDIAEDNARRIDTLLAITSDVSANLAKNAESNRDAGNANWGITGSLAYLAGTLVEMLDGFEGCMTPDQICAVNAIKEERRHGF